MKIILLILFLTPLSYCSPADKNKKLKAEVQKIFDEEGVKQTRAVKSLPPPPPSTPEVPKTFKNPILDEHISEPSIIHHDNAYYMVRSKRNTIEILKSTRLSNFRHAERHEIYNSKNPKGTVRSPKIYSIQGDLYIYFSLADDEAEDNHRLQVMKCNDSRNPMGKWGNDRLFFQEQILDHDGTILQHGNGDMYFIWSGKPHSDDNAWNLYIARMENPMKVVGPRTLLRAPKMEWEQRRYPSNRAPFILPHRGRNLLVFSASCPEDADCCLGIMGVDGARDPMLTSNWWNDVGHCVFGRNDTEGVWGPGYASFVQSPDESETWMIYTACVAMNDCGNRTVRIQKIRWKANTPKFPAALGTQAELKLPRGESLVA